MGCRIRSVSDNEYDDVSNNNSLTEALLFTTMCIIGLPVEVHVNDGSVYSGIFHTACVENDFGVVLKKAKMIKKGISDANVVIGYLMETLVVLSRDLVQVVAKGVLLPSNGAVENVAGDSVDHAACIVPITENAAKTAKPGKFGRDRNQFHKTSLSRKYAEENLPAEFDKSFEEEKRAPKISGHSLTIKNRRRDDIHATKSEEITVFPVNDRHEGYDVSKGDQNGYSEKFEFQEKETAREDQDSKLRDDCVTQVKPPKETHLHAVDECVVQVKASKEVHAKVSFMTLADGRHFDNPASSVFKPVNKCYEIPTSTNATSSDVVSSGVSTSASSAVSVKSESGPGSLAAPSGMVHKRSSVSNRSGKGFKLNPEAKVFSPFVKPQSQSMPSSIVSSISYIPNDSPLVQVASAQPEIAVNSFVPRSSLPNKVVPYDNLTVGNTGSGSQYSQPIAGHGGRTQPVRFVGQYHPMQAGPTYGHPNSQVMVGRSGQLFYVHPVSHDAFQNSAAISPVPARPVLTSHQIHYPKHLGTQAPQTLQIYVPPHLVATVQPPIIVPSQIPILQPNFIASRQMPMPMSNGLYSSKFQ